MNRRDFLKLSMLGLAQMVLWRYLPACKSVKGKRILVIGAGMAGLAAARELRANGHDVTILEGRERVGGRIWTDHSLEIPIDLGASWIHGIKGNPITKLAKEFNVAHVATDYNDIDVYDAAGKHWARSEIDALEEAFNHDFQKALAFAEDQDADLSLADALQKIISKSSQTAEQKRAYNWIQAEQELEYAANFSKMSAWNFGDDDEFAGSNDIFPGGYEAIIKGLSAGLTIKLGHTVKQIALSETSVSVQTTQGEFKADAVLVTLPLGILKKGSVKFVPELPARKRQAIEKLGMGLLNKIVLRFAKPFWPKDKDFLNFMSETIGVFPEFLNLQKSFDLPVLIAFAGGDFARSLEKQSDAQITAQVMTVLRKMFGSAVTEPVGVKITRWSQDPFAFGSYSNMALGASGEDYEALAQPVQNKLFFAGEATHRQYPATVHGAFLSGVREAKLMGG